jgi:type I restriction enzyme S subunit
VGKVYPTDKCSIDQEYLYQVLSRQGFADEILSLADGSAQGNVSGSLIETYKVPIPPLQIQKAIAHILGTLDDKIELNRKTNETLEAMAKALFRSWFVDFDPVRAMQKDATLDCQQKSATCSQIHLRIRNWVRFRVGGGFAG